MKFFIVLAVVIALAVAVPVPGDLDTTVLKQSSAVEPDGYQFEYETSDGVARDETGKLKNVGSDTEALEVTGAVKWTAPDGREYSLTFVADENGYRPVGEHIPHL